MLTYRKPEPVSTVIGRHLGYQAYDAHLFTHREDYADQSKQNLLFTKLVWHIDNVVGTNGNGGPHRATYTVCWVNMAREFDSRPDFYEELVRAPYR